MGSFTTAVCQSAAARGIANTEGRRPIEHRGLDRSSGAGAHGALLREDVTRDPAGHTSHRQMSAFLDRWSKCESPSVGGRICQYARPRYAVGVGRGGASPDRLLAGEAGSVRTPFVPWYLLRTAADADAASCTTSALTLMSPSATGGGRDTRRLASMSAGETHGWSSSGPTVAEAGSMSLCARWERARAGPARSLRSACSVTPWASSSRPPTRPGWRRTRARDRDGSRWLPGSPGW